MRAMWQLAALASSGLAIAGAAGAQPASNARFMVFFDWGRPDLRGDDSATLDGVAQAWGARPNARLRLTGHTDRSGGVAVNRAAGMRRAETVRAELQKRGIPRNAMRIASLGEEQPLVPTEDGVREVQNRRVVIEFED